MSKLVEVWKPVKNFEGIYEVSNLGIIKSLKNEKRKKEIFIKGTPDYEGYFVSALQRNGKRKQIKIAHVVWDHFGDRPRNGHKLQVDHIDGNKSNNRIDNLQLLTNRENTSKYRKSVKHSSKYTGVSYTKYKKTNKWRATIQINYKLKHLGYYSNEYDAHLAYEKALKEVTKIEIENNK